MTLEDIKDVFKNTSLAHVGIKEFNYGETFDLPNGGNNEYPFVFLEIPYLETYGLPLNKFKTYSFALNILIKTPPDDREKDHQAISDADLIGEAIITRIQLENRDISFDTITALSLREFSDDDLAGMRFEFDIRTKRNYCNPASYADQFNDC